MILKINWSFSREGNMINALNNSNPTHLLLSSLSDVGIYSPSSQYSSQSTTPFFKGDEQFALGVLDANGQVGFSWPFMRLLGDEFFARSRGLTKSLRATLHHAVAAYLWTHLVLPRSAASFKLVLVLNI